MDLIFKPVEADFGKASSNDCEQRFNIFYGDSLEKKRHVREGVINATNGVYKRTALSKFYERLQFSECELKAYTYASQCDRGSSSSRGTQ